jgi:Tfp pilus assembly protein PilF
MALSRHDEFEADALGARLTSAGASRRALRTIEAAGVKGARVSWKDRIIQVQRDGTLAEWLREKLIPADAEEATRLLEQAEKVDEADDFSTHPRMAERLAALGSEAVVLPARAEAPAISLLHDPDALAREALEHLRKTIAEQEESVSRQILRSVRSNHRSVSYRGYRVGAILFFLVAAITGIINVVVWETEDTTMHLVIMAVFLALGSWSLARSLKKEKTLLPIPNLSDWDDSFEKRATVAPTQKWVEARAGELRASLPASAQSQKDQISYLRREAYEALRKCDYERALAAVHLLEPLDKSLEWHLAAAIAYAWHHYDDAAAVLVGKMLKERGLGPSVSWAVAWVLLIVDADGSAEPFLLDVANRREDSAVLWSLLGSCQARLDRDEAGIAAHHRAIALATDTTWHRLRLVDVLLGLGRCREAREELAFLPATFQHHKRALSLELRTALQLGEAAEAAQATARLEAEHPGLESQLYVAQSLLETHHLDDAAVRLTAVNHASHVPIARLMLATIHGRREQKDAARGELLAALDVTRAPGVGNITGLHILPQICSMLASLAEPTPNCRAWSARVDLSAIPGPEPRPKVLTVAVTATDEGEGRRQLGDLYAALYPGATLMQSQVTWEMLPKERQPNEPVRPAIWFEELE